MITQKSKGIKSYFKASSVTTRCLFLLPKMLSCYWLY
nr:MAG TPA: hypothetical protein [Caudoviricetes sp.]